jgi:hypothetical protein
LNTFNSIRKNPYSLLAHFISPWKKPNDIKSLQHLISDGAVIWEDLLLQSNYNLCAPLWYVCLKNDGLLNLLPEELQKYLQALYQANLERNIFFREALLDLHKKFLKNHIPYILMKGGITLFDNLYNDLGARLLQDLDILVRPENAEKAWQILVKSGYVEIPDPGKEFEGLPTDKRHSHLKAQRKPGTPVVIEIHYKTSYAKAGEILPANEAWENTVKICYSGFNIQILSPTFRLIHNTAHGLIPHAEFIEGTVLLQQLAEFVFIVKKCSSRISWEDWLASGKNKGAVTEFLTYLVLAQNTMGMKIPTGLAPSRLSKFHAIRIASGGRYLKNYVTLPESLLQKVKIKLMRFVLKSYYMFKLPAWVWQNVCYTGGEGNTLQRLNYLFRKAFSPRSRAKI